MLLNKYDKFCEAEEYLRLLRDVALSDAIDPSSEIDLVRISVAEHLASNFKPTNEDVGAMADIKRRLAHQRKGAR